MTTEGRFLEFVFPSKETNSLSGICEELDAPVVLDRGKLYYDGHGYQMFPGWRKGEMVWICTETMCRIHVDEWFRSDALYLLGWGVVVHEDDDSAELTFPVRIKLNE